MRDVSSHIQNRVAHRLSCDCVPAWQPLEGGRTNILWRRICACGDVVVKQYDPKRCSAVFQNDPALEAAVLRQLHESGLTPALRFYEPHGDTPLLCYQYQDTDNAGHAPKQAAQLLNRLAVQVAPSGLPHRMVSSDGIAQLVGTLCVDMSSAQRKTLDDMRPIGQVTDCGCATLCHGDFVASNILVTGGQVMAIDWQTPFCGSAAWDIAMYLSPSMQARYAPSALSDAQTAEFLGALKDGQSVAHYEALRPWFYWMMAAYAMWRGARYGDSTAQEDFTLEAAALERVHECRANDCARCEPDR